MSTVCRPAAPLVAPGQRKPPPPLGGYRVEPDDLRRVMRNQASSVCIITAGLPADGGEPVGVTATSLVSLSLDPPLVSFSFALDSNSARAWQRTRRGVVHLLHESQQELALRFAGTRQERFTPDVTWHWDECAGPVLAEALAWLTVTPVARLRTGDHLLVLARVTQTKITPGLRPMVYHDGNFASLAARDISDGVPGR